jgi:hypothetical protein
VADDVGCFVAGTESFGAYCGFYFGYYCVRFDVSCKMAEIFSGEGCEKTETNCQGVP